MRRNVFPATEISVHDRRDLGSRDNVFPIWTQPIFSNSCEIPCGEYVGTHRYTIFVSHVHIPVRDLSCMHCHVPPFNISYSFPNTSGIQQSTLEEQRQLTQQQHEVSYDEVEDQLYIGCILNSSGAGCTKAGWISIFVYLLRLIQQFIRMKHWIWLVLERAWLKYRSRLTSHNMKTWSIFDCIFLPFINTLRKIWKETSRN